MSGWSSENVNVTEERSIERERERKGALGLACSAETSTDHGLMQWVKRPRVDLEA